MTKIIEKRKLSEFVWSYLIEAPQIAKKSKAGQFVILRVTHDGERIPLTIANADSSKGWIEIIFQVVGLSTTMLAELNVGDEIVDLVGPLGRPTHIEKFGRCLCIGGGVGVAPLYPIVKALKLAGNNITTIIGARSQPLLILEKEIRALSDEIFIATDDGSCGQKGFVSDVLKQLLRNKKYFDYAVVIGPPIMMKLTSAITLSAGITTYVSLNPVMIDGTGMCGGCRVNVDGKAYFACIDGPEFNAKGIDWDILNNRLTNYGRQSSSAVSEHSCKLQGKSKL